jgi:hypothetical protein
VEEEVFIPLALSLDPRDPRAAGIRARVERSMDPSCGRDAADRRARQALRDRVEAQKFVPTSGHGAFPGCEREGRGPEALPLSAHSIAVVGEKLTRVVLYARYRVYLDRGEAVTTHVVSRGDEEERVARLIRGGERIEVPPDVFVAIRRASDSPRHGLAIVDLWGRVRLFTSFLPSEVSSASTTQPGWS